MDEGTNIATAVAPRLIIERPRLTRKLDKSNARIILLVAPAGYGKTTLARQWLEHRDHAWYQATSASADAAGFSQGLDRVLHLDEDDRNSVKSLIVSNPALADDPVELANILAERLVDWTRDRWIAIDDYHLVARSETAEALVSELVAITDVRFFVTSRLHPRWAAARRVIYGEVMEIDMAQLAMTEAEAGELLSRSPQHARLRVSAEGWPALLGLAAATEYAETPNGLSAELVYEYLANELLSEATEHLERMLYEIACAPSGVVDVLRRWRRPDLVSAAIARGFLREEPDGYSMHPLAQAFLEDRFRRRSDHLKIAASTARHLIESESWDAAFSVIERFGLAQHLEGLLERAGIPMLRQGRSETVSEWVSSAKATNKPSAVADVIDAAIFEHRADYLASYRLARSAASRLGSAHPLYADALILAARSAYMSDRTNEAIDLYADAREGAMTWSNELESLLGAFFASINVDPGLANRLLGELAESSGHDDPETHVRVATAQLMFALHFGCVERTIPLATSAGKRASKTSSWASSAFFFAYSGALTAAGHYDAARRAAEASLAEVRRSRLAFAIPHVQIRLANASLGLGHFSDAARILSQVLRRARLRGDRYFESFASGLMIRLLISQNLAADALTSVYAPRANPAWPVTFAEHAAARSLAFACVGDTTRSEDMAKRSEAASRPVEATVLIRTARLLANLETGQAHAGERLRDLLEVIQLSGNYDGAVSAIRGSSMLRDYLSSARPDETNPGQDAVLRRLLDVAEIHLQPLRPPDLDDAEARPLSTRELEVIELLKQGLSNKQMARALFISDVTVKAHLRRIYDKLGVRTRTEAALWAQSRELD